MFCDVEKTKQPIEKKHVERLKIQPNTITKHNDKTKDKQKL